MPDKPHVISAWLGDALGLVVPEFGFEDMPQDQHPLLPPSMRVRHAA
jgi:hypothetical protein